MYRGTRSLGMPSNLLYRIRFLITPRAARPRVVVFELGGCRGGFLIFDVYGLTPASHREFR